MTATLMTASPNDCVHYYSDNTITTVYSTSTL